MLTRIVFCFIWEKQTNKQTFSCPYFLQAQSNKLKEMFFATVSFTSWSASVWANEMLELCSSKYNHFSLWYMSTVADIAKGIYK